MPLLNSKSKKKQVSNTPRASSSATTSSSNKATASKIYPHQSTLLSRLPPNASTPTVYQQQYNTNLSNQSSPTLGNSTQQQPSYQGASSLVSPYDSPTPTPSTSWTSEMSAFVDKLRDDAASIVGSTKYQTQQQQHLQTPPLDRRSVSQGMKLVAIAADEYEDGNDDVALDIYLSGIDKILMALPNKTDPKTKTAIREKLQSVEERVGILNLATQYKRLPNIDFDNDHDDKQDDTTLSGRSTTTTTTTTTTTSMFSRISTTMSTISSIGSTTVQAWEENNASMQSSDQRGSIQRFKRFGQFVINTSVTCAVLIKQSPIPDIIGLICNYLLLLVSYLDRQYQVREKAQSVGIECVKMLLAADEQYHLHEIATETIYMLFAASLKAAVAFKESPSYHHPADSNLTSAQISNDSENVRQIEYQSSEVPPSSSNLSSSPSPPPPAASGSRLPKMLSGWY
ncbi:hypothetical protein BCR42DRAFT_417956 [Absidia repens]|uniref:MIT domain-containing protein n=1 Tax=Absidia repens TaxID=90262 RepID=A0A1X2ICV4_9FUNG|nr:hypothetical protein BCR42DRAFT_417956 [Absidia repens]